MSSYNLLMLFQTNEIFFFFGTFCESFDAFYLVNFYCENVLVTMVKVQGMVLFPSWCQYLKKKREREKKNVSK